MTKIVWSMLTVLSRLISGVLVFYFLAVFVTVDSFGRLTYYFTLAVILGLIIDYGYNLRLSRDAVNQQTDLTELVGRAIIVKLLNTLFSFTFLVIYLNALETPLSDVIVVLIFLLSQAVQSIGSTLYPLLRAAGEFKTESKVAFANNLVLFLVFLLVSIPETTRYYAMPIAFLAGRSVILTTFLKSTYFRKARFSVKGIAKELAVGFSFFSHAAVGYLYFNLDTILLKNYVSFSDIGRYQAAMKFVLGAVVFGEVLTNYFMPELIRKGFKNGKVVLSYHKKLFSLITVSGVLFSIAAYVAIEKLMPLVFGEEYSVSTLTVILLSAVVLSRYFGVYFGMLLTILDKQFVRVVGGSTALVVLIVSMVLLTPHMGLDGAAVSALLANLAILFIYAFTGLRALKT